MYSSSSSDREANDDVEDLDSEDEKLLEKAKITLQRSAQIKNANGTYRCPFCKGRKKQDYKYNEILQHAAANGKGGHSLKHRQHQLLHKRLEHADMKPCIAAAAPQEVQGLPMSLPMNVSWTLLTGCNECELVS